jgi:hypothetical protein
MTVLSDMNSAPTAGESTMPIGASTPAAKGSAMTLYPVALDRLKGGYGRQPQPTVLCGPHDGAGHGMLRIALDGRGEGQGAVLLPAVGGHHLHHAELTAGKGARLVKDDRIEGHL